MKGIYCWINTINNKKYIGQSIDIEERYNSYIRFSRNEKFYKKQKIYEAIHDFGLENFTFQIIEELNNEDELTLREEY